MAFEHQHAKPKDQGRPDGIVQHRHPNGEHAHPHSHGWYFDEGSFPVPDPADWTTS